MNTIDKIEKCLIPEAKSEGWIILFKEKNVRLPNGKSLWKRKNHAGAALTNFLCGYMRDENYSEYGVRGSSELSKKLQEEGIFKIQKI